VLLFVILVIAGYAIYCLTPEERLRIFRRGQAQGNRYLGIAIAAHQAPEPLRDALRIRTPWALVTGAIVFVNLTMFLFMSAGTGSLSEPETLASWGANFGPLTSNGEWWRLATSLFVHAGLLHVLASVIGLAQVGVMMERMVGHLAFAVVYLAAGLLASLEALSSNPLVVNVGATGAIFGVYGLLLAAVGWSFFQPSTGEHSQPGSTSDSLGLRNSEQGSESTAIGELLDPSLPVILPAPSLAALKTLGPSVGIFLAYTVLTGGFDTVALTGLVAGFASGLILTRKARESAPPAFQAAAAMGVTLVLVVASAVMLRGVEDVRPEIARLVALEDRTAVAYNKAVEQFKNGALSSQALAKMISQTIVPELRAAHARVKAVNGVPQEHQALVESAEEYFRLRDESWRLRVEALQKSNMKTLRAADRSERASLDALQRIRPADSASAEPPQ
jgi:membrane associated rhomboid family serine protease